MCSYAFCLFLKKNIVAVGKSKVTIEEQRTQARCTTTSTEERAHHTAHFTAAGKPAACTYFSAFSRIRLTHSAVVRKEYVKKMSGNLNEATTPARKKRHKKEQTASRASVGQNK